MNTENETNMLEAIAIVMRQYGFRDVRFPSATATPEIFDGSIAFELKMTAWISADTVLSMGKDVAAELQRLDSRITGQGVSISKSPLGLKADSWQWTAVLPERIRLFFRLFKLRNRRMPR